MAASVTRAGFWSEIETLKRVVEVQGAKFADDTNALRLRRMAEAVVLPEVFNRTYLPHYFRDGGCSAHALILMVLTWERRAAIRVPRGHGKSTLASFAYILRQMVLGPILRAWVEGRLEAEDPALYGAIREVMAEELTRIRDAGPLQLRALGVPEHHDPLVELRMQAWLDDLYVRQVAATEIPLTWDPYIQLIAVDGPTALERTTAVKVELEQNALLQSDWGELAPCYSGDWESKVRKAPSGDDFESRGVRLRGFGMTEAIRGGLHGPWRPSMAMFDDADSEESARTLLQRDANMAKLAGAVDYGLEPPPKGRVFALGTPHHPDAMICRLTEHDSYRGWLVVRFRAMDEQRVVLYPEKWTAGAIDEKVFESPEKAASELLDEPPAQAARPFHTLHYYSRKQFATVELLKVLAFDPALGRSSTSDFQALVELRGPTEEGWILVWRVWFLRIADPLALVEEVSLIYEEVEPDLALIETIGFQALLQAMLHARAELRHTFAAWVEISSHDEGKDLRVRGTAPLVNRGQIRFPDDRSCKQLETQYKAWGDKGSKRDGPDIVEMGVRKLRTYVPKAQGSGVFRRVAQAKARPAEPATRRADPRPPGGRWAGQRGGKRRR